MYIEACALNSYRTHIARLKEPNKEPLGASGTWSLRDTEVTSAPYVAARKVLVVGVRRRRIIWVEGLGFWGLRFWVYPKAP